MMPVEYVELHCHSYYSFLDGASSPEALVEQAAALGYPALALTDHDGLYGAVRFWRAAVECGLHPLIGAEVGYESGPDERHLVLLAETQAGYANLCRLLSTGQLAGQKGAPRLTLEMLAGHAAGLLCLSGCRRGAVPAALEAKDEQAARRAAGELWDIFGGRLWIELQRHYLPTDARLNTALVQLAGWLGAGLVATNNVHYADRAGQHLHDVLTCIRHHVTLPEAAGGGLLHPNSEFALKSPQEVAHLFRDLPSALASTVEIAERCRVRLDFSAQQLPTFPLPAGQTEAGCLRRLCEEGLGQLPRSAFAEIDPIPSRALAQLDHELAVIERAGLCGYFLVVWDIVRYARERGIRCQGRGSAANSLVAYLLGITPVDPLRHNLLFERFLSDDAHTMPDIDVDFAADRREEVIQYVYERYGEDHVGMVCNVVTYRARSALREAAQALAFPPDVIDRAAKALDTRSAGVAAEELEHLLAEVQAPGEVDLPWSVLAGVLRGMEGVPRHLSIHVGGMLITAPPLVEVVPLERAAMPGRVVVQWDKDSVEDAGLIKIDLLSLRTLGMVEEALVHIRAQWGVDLDLARLPLDDPAVYALLQRADTVGCFQVESRAQAQMLPRLRPTCFEDLIVEVALVRPGPIQGHMVHPYLNRRQGLEPVAYAHPVLELALAETLGVMVFQEQAIRVAVAIAGFTAGEADRLRRALRTLALRSSRSRSAEAMAALGARFLAGATAKGVEPETAKEVLRQLMAFSGYGFCKSHAAAFALVAYQTLYLKAHYPAAFFCALLNHQPMGFYGPDVLLGDARRHGVPVLSPDANLSEQACTLERNGSTLAVRLGLCYVHGLGEARQAHLVERRGGQPFRDLGDFCRRTHLPRAIVENLIRAGAMDSLGRTRRDLLWALGGLTYREEELALEAVMEQVELPVLEQVEQTLWEYELLGLAPSGHLLGIYREQLQSKGVLSSRDLASRQSGEKVWVAGIVVVRQRPPSANGHVFLTLEDEEGLVNLIVRPREYEQYRDVLRGAPLLVAEGCLQRADGAMSVLVYRAAALFGKRISH